MRAVARAAVAAGVVLAGLSAVPVAGASAATPPTSVAHPAIASSAGAAGPAAPAPVIAAYPPGVSHTQFLKALEHARATGNMQHQATHLLHGAAISSGSSASGYALPAGPSPVPCVNNSVAWPNVTNNGLPCYLSTYQGQYVLAHGAQDVFPGQSAVLGVKYGPTQPQAGQVAPAAWQLAWNNLFDFEPLMRDTLGHTGNDITGYDNEFLIPPSLDNTSCYNAVTGPDGGGYNFGRYQNQCTIVDSGGPYYGTPAGQQVPWTLMTGAVGWSTSGIPAVYNCGGTCNAEWVGDQIETPVMLEPSPYASFSDSIGTDDKTVTFTDQTLSDLQITSWNWNFGDGSTSSTQSPVHKYAKGGQYTVTLTVTANGQVSTTSATVTPPGTLGVSATLSQQAVEVGGDATFDVTVTNPNKDAVTGVGVTTVDDPTDGSFTVDPTGTCVINCVDPLPAGASSTYQIGITGEAPNDPTAADVVTIDAAATIDGAAVTGTTTSPEVPVDDALTVTDIDPTGGQIYGGDPVTVYGTGFQTLLGTDTVTSVDFIDQAGGTSLPGTSVVVDSPTELTVDAPDASSLVDPAGTGTFDVIVSTDYAESPSTPVDEYEYGCQDETDTPAGQWEFSGCFNSPQPDEYTTTTKATIDGLDLTPAGGTSATSIDTVAESLTLPAGGTVALTVGGASTPVCKGALDWDLSAASVSCPAPGGHVLGLTATGPVTLTPKAGGTVDGSAPVRLPGILGASTGTLSFVVSSSGGLTSASVAAPTAASVVGLVTAKVSSMTLAVGSGTWNVAGTATASTGATATVSASFAYDSSGNLSSGSLTLGKLDVAGVMTWTSLGLSYSTATKLWTGSPGIVGATGAGTASFTVADATGVVSAGTISSGAVSLFGALPLGSLTLTDDGSSWALTSTPESSGAGTVSATFPVTAGQIVGATVTQDDSPIALYGQLPANAAVLAYSVVANLPVYTGPLTVDLPGATDTGTAATLTVTDDKAAKIKIASTSNTALFGGVTLNSLSAAVTGPVGAAGTTACGTTAASVGPQVGTGTNQIATLKGGGLNLAYPKASGSALYQLTGKLAVPTWKTGGGSLGIATFGLLEGQATASVKLALGTGTASGKCPLAAIPAPSTLTLATGITVNGLLTGTEGDAVFFLQGPATVADPAVSLLPAAAKGTVVVNEIGLTACAPVAGHAGLYGFAMTWAGAFSTYSTGNCVLPTTSTGFGCMTQTGTPAGSWLFSGCFSSPATGQFASTLQATLDGLGLNPAGGSSTVVIDTGAKTATVPSGGTVTVTQGTTVSTLCAGPLAWSLTAASVSCTPPSGGRLFGLAMTGAVTLTPKAGGVVTGSVPVRLPGILGAGAGTLTFSESATGGLQSASVAVAGNVSVAQLDPATVTSMVLTVTSGLWTITGTVHPQAGATATLTATAAYDATGTLSKGTVKVGRLDLAGALTWNSLSLTYSTTTKLWTGAPTFVGATAAGAVSLNVTDATGAVVAGSLTVGATAQFAALPLGSLSLTYGGSAWHLASTPAASGGGTFAATFPVVSGGITGATLTESGGPIALYGQLPASGAVLAYAIVAGAPVYSGPLTVALPGATTTATAATLTSTNDAAAVVKVASTATTSLFAGVAVTSLTAPVKAPTATVGTTVCGPASMTVGPVVSGPAPLATLKGGLSFVYPKTGGVPYQMVGKLAVPALKTGAGSLGIASLSLAPGAATGTVKLALGTGTASATCPLAALPAPTTLTLAKGVTITGTLTGTEGASTFFLKGAGTFAYPAVTVLPASATGTITTNTTGITACAAVAGHTGLYGFSETWAGVFTAYSTGNCTLPTS